MTEFAPARHEAAHCVAAWVVGLPVQHATIRPGEDGSLGRCSLAPPDEATLARNEDDPLGFATMLVAGGQAERFALGRDHWYRVNFLWDDGSDEARAREWIAAEASRNEWDELSCRDLVQLRGRGLVFSHWEEIEALASTLQQRRTLLGGEVTKIIIDAHNGKRRKRDRSKPISREQAMTRMTPRGKQRLLGAVAADGKTRVEKAVLNKE